MNHFSPIVSASAQLLEQTARLQNLSDALDKLKVTTSVISPLFTVSSRMKTTNLNILTLYEFLFQGEVAEHVVSYQPGAKASSDFATFPVSSFVKVKPALHKSAMFRLFLQVFTHVTYMSTRPRKRSREEQCLWVV